MSNEIATLLYGAIGGGLVSAGLRVVETYLVAPRLSEAVEARKKLFMYARPLWSACHAVEFRLNMLYEQSTSDQKIPTLQLNPKEAKSLDWFTKEGYYVTSTAYLIAAVASWIVLFERDVVFLKFDKESLTIHFFYLIEEFKRGLSSDGSPLWFYYTNGIGEQLVKAGESKPMTLANFSYELFKDEDFRNYYDQLFQFLHQVGQGQHLKNIQATLSTLIEMKRFLESNDIVVELGQTPEKRKISQQRKPR
jgi:hypothetical protein